MSSEEVDICKNMVNHLLSENTNLKKQLKFSKDENNLLQNKLIHFLENLNESWSEDYKKLLLYTIKLEQNLSQYN